MYLFEAKDYRIKNKRSCNNVLTCMHECLFLYIILENVPFKIMLDYWDVENRAHYNQTENFDVVVNGINQTIVPRENNLPTET